MALKRVVAMVACAMVACAMVGACGSDAGGPGGSAHASGRVVSPNGNEGAALIDFAGAIDTMTVTGGSAFLQTTNGRTRAVIVLDQPGTIRFTLPNIATGAAPAGTVVQVADGANALRASVSAYRVEYAR